MCICNLNLTCDYKVTTIAITQEYHHNLADIMHMIMYFTADSIIKKIFGRRLIMPLVTLTDQFNREVGINSKKFILAENIYTGRTKFKISKQRFVFEKDGGKASSVELKDCYRRSFKEMPDEINRLAKALKPADPKI